MAAKLIPNQQDAVRFRSTLPRFAKHGVRQTLSADPGRFSESLNGLRRERSLFCFASRTMGGGTPWVHECPFSTVVVFSFGMGAAQVRFLKGAPAVVKAPASAV